MYYLLQKFVCNAKASKLLQDSAFMWKPKRKKSKFNLRKDQWMYFSEL